MGVAFDVDGADEIHKGGVEVGCRVTQRRVKRPCGRSATMTLDLNFYIFVLFKTGEMN